MKKTLLLFMGLMLTVAVVFAQPLTVSSTLSNNLTGLTSGYMKSTPTHAVQDTFLNAVTKYQYLGIAGYQQRLTIQPVATKISGTAAATITVEGSNNGVDYIPITAVGDTLLITNLSTAQTKKIELGPAEYMNYRLKIIPSGTQAVSIKTTWLTRNPLYYKLP